MRDRYRIAGTTEYGFGHACWVVSFNPVDLKGVLAKHRKDVQVKARQSSTIALFHHAGKCGMSLSKELSNINVSA